MATAFLVIILAIARICNIVYVTQIVRKTRNWQIAMFVVEIDHPSIWTLPKGPVQFRNRISIEKTLPSHFAHYKLNFVWFLRLKALSDHFIVDCIFNKYSSTSWWKQFQISYIYACYECCTNVAESLDKKNHIAYPVGMNIIMDWNISIKILSLWKHALSSSRWANSKHKNFVFLLEIHFHR